MQKYKILDKALMAKDCYNAVRSNNHADVLIDCMTENTLKELSPEALVLSSVKTVGSLGNWFASAISGNVDGLKDEANYQIIIKNSTSQKEQIIAPGSANTNNKSGMPCPEPTPGGDQLHTTKYWMLCGVSLLD